MLSQNLGVSRRAPSSRIPKMGLDDADIVAPWTLTAADQALVMAKNVANRLGFALLFLFHRAHGRFPKTPTEIGAKAVARVAQQLGVKPSDDDDVRRDQSDLEAPSGRDPAAARLSRSDGRRRGTARRLAARSGGGCRSGAGPARCASGDAMSRAFDRAARGRSHRPDRPRRDPCS